MEEITILLPRTGVTVRGQRTDSRVGTPTLCLHGWLDNCASFEPMFERLGELNLIAIDLPGHGLSDPLPAPTCQLLDYAACLLELVEVQGWEQLRLVGHSIGAALASIVAGIQPEKVTRLALIDAILPHAGGPDEIRTSVARYLKAYLAPDWAKVPVHRTRHQAIKARVQLGDILLDTVDTLARRDIEEVPGGYAWRTDARLRFPMVLSLDEEQVRTFLRAISAPTLLINAERTLQERLYPNTLDAVPDLRQITIAGGHHLHLENVEPVAAAVRDFLLGED